MPNWDIYLVNPDANHASWGAAISTEPRHRERRNYDFVGTVSLVDQFYTDDPTSCESAVQHLLAFDRSSFHQGGHHDPYNTLCGGWHYIEYFGMDKSTERGLELLAYLEGYVAQLNGTLAPSSV